MNFFREMLMMVISPSDWPNLVRISDIELSLETMTVTNDLASYFQCGARHPSIMSHFSWRCFGD